MIYLDTSVLVAYYVPEPLSDRAQQIITSTPVVIVSELVQAEFVAALSLRFRVGHVERTTVQQIASLFLQHVTDAFYSPLHLPSAVYSLARSYITRFDLPLKAPDALHLAAAALEELTLVTADRQLARNAETLGIAVELLVAP
jgi:uncharacterized protein